MDSDRMCEDWPRSAIIADQVLHGERLVNAPGRLAESWESNTRSLGEMLSRAKVKP